MSRGIRITYFVTVTASALVGLWHFFVPWMFRWYDYLPTQYENLIVGIDWVNYCFSFLLFGLSVMLVILGKRALALNKEVIFFYFFLTLVGCFAPVLPPLSSRGRWSLCLRQRSDSWQRRFCLRH